MFLIYINDIPEGIQSICKIFADDTSLFSIVKKDKLSENSLNSDLEKVSEWAHQWNMLFNPDPSKQEAEVYFSRKQNQDGPLPLGFNDNTVQIVEVYKHLSLSLYKKLDFNIHIDNKINKCNKKIGIVKQWSLSISRNSLLTIQKTFVRPYLNYADIIYDKAGNVNFESKLGVVRYDAYLALQVLSEGPIGTVYM